MEDRSSGIVKVSIKGICVNFLLVIFKAIVGFIAGSIAIILDAVNNLTDAMSSGITIVGVKLAGKKPTKKHPYGYGRIEYLTSIVIAIIILGAAITAGYESVLKIIHSKEATYEIYSFIIIIAAIFVKIFLGLYFRKKGKALSSSSLTASGTDAIMDSVLSFTTLIAMIVSVTTHKSIEGYLGVLIAIFIFKAGCEIITETLSLIIGERADSELTNGLKALACSFDGVRGCYDVVIHNYGPERIIGSAHIEVPDDMTSRDIHILTEEITFAAYRQYGIILTVGIYASNDSDEFSSSVKKEINEMIKETPEIIQMHGFYVDQKTKTIIFDIIFRFEDKEPQETRDNLLRILKGKYPDYNIIINMDTDFSD